MRKYTNPVIEIKELEVIDVIQTSGGGLIDGGEGGDAGDIVIPKPVSVTDVGFFKN